jgi:hypothetical protein
MILRTLCHIAGVDRETLLTCPMTDSLWVAHLGFSLFLSFAVVFAITFHATGYVIADVWLRSIAALVVALTVVLFDRALYQSDWFSQGAFGGQADSATAYPGIWRFLRVAVRLTISFGLAWVIAVFLELAIFSDTIGDKLKHDNLAANQGIYEKIQRYEAQLDEEINQHRSDLAASEALYQRELATPLLNEPSTSSLADEYAPQIAALESQERDLRTEVRQVEQKILTYAEEMNAEELGRRLNPNNSGRAGTGPRFQFAKQQKELYEQQRTDRERELSQLRAKGEDLRNTQARNSAEAMERRIQDRSSIQAKRDTLRSQAESARTELQELQLSRLAKTDELWRQAFASSEFQKQKDDPLSRMTAYQALKNDPTDGPTITLFSWMTKFVVIFLEIVPVTAKIFFSPPSVYAAKVQAQIKRGRERACLEGVEPVDEASRGRLVAYPPREMEVAPKEPPRLRAGAVEPLGVGRGNGAMVEPLRHRQTKEAETDMFSLQPPRHIPTLPFA